jgi:hypothetical protein
MTHPEGAPVDWKTSLKAALVASGVGTAFGLVTFFLLTKWSPGMGSALFLATPVVAGFSISLVSRGGNSAAAAGIISIAFTLVVLIAMGKEGALCAILAVPIVGFGLIIGVLLGSAARHLLLNDSDHETTTMGVLLLVGPALIFVTDWIERPLLQVPRTEVIETSVKVADSPEHVWNHILTVDNVAASKPFLMHIGLPIPERCSLSGKGVGAKRTCYFNSGYIEETITAWNPPFYMGLNIDRTHMAGRHWLGFENAAYTLQPDGNSTILTRTTTVSSRLLPVWYWRPFERLGVSSEHRYILQDVVLKATP